MHQRNVIRAAACLVGAAALSLAGPAAVNAQAKPTYTLFNNSVDLSLQQTCTDTPNGATFTGTIGATNHAGSGESSLYYTFDASGNKTGYESVSAVNTLNVGATPARFRFVAVSADCSGESLYVWPGSTQSVADPDGTYAFPLSAAVEEPLH
jgi:hypothetical protein